MCHITFVVCVCVCGEASLCTLHQFCFFNSCLLRISVSVFIRDCNFPWEPHLICHQIHAGLKGTHSSMFLIASSLEACSKLSIPVIKKSPYCVLVRVFELMCAAFRRSSQSATLYIYWKVYFIIPLFCILCFFC